MELQRILLVCLLQVCLGSRGLHAEQVVELGFANHFVIVRRKRVGCVGGVVNKLLNAPVNILVVSVLGNLRMVGRKAGGQAGRQE